MTVTVWYKDEPDCIYEDAIDVKACGNGVSITSLNRGNVVNDIVELDEDTRIEISM